MITKTPEQIVKAAAAYRQGCLDGKSQTFLRPDFWAFCGWIDESADDIQALVKGQSVTWAADPTKADGFDELPEEQQKQVQEEWRCHTAAAVDKLRKLCTFIRGEYNVGSAWSGVLSPKAIFLQKQDFDGAALRERQQVEQSGDITIKLVGDFGGVADPFA